MINDTASLLWLQHKAIQPHWPLIMVFRFLLYVIPAFPCQGFSLSLSSSPHNLRSSMPSLAFEGPGESNSTVVVFPSPQDVTDPFPSPNFQVLPLLCLSTMLTKLSGMTQCPRMFQSLPLLSLSKAFLQSMKPMDEGVCHSALCSKIFPGMKIFSVVLVFFHGTQPVSAVIFSPLLPVSSSGALGRRPCLYGTESKDIPR